MTCSGMKRKVTAVACLLAFIGMLSAEEGRKWLLYHTDFSKMESGELPADFLVLEGSFSIEKSAEESYLKLSPTPLVDSAVQMGERFEGDGVIQVRIKAESEGRRAPSFGVGLHGVSGFQLSVVPSGKKIELKQGAEVVQSSKFKWRSGEWYFVELRVLENGSNWTVSGRVWAESEKRPDSAQIEYIADVKSLKGRAYVSGMPSSGRAIHFDDVEIRRR